MVVMGLLPALRRLQGLTAQAHGTVPTGVSVRGSEDAGILGVRRGAKEANWWA